MTQQQSNRAPTAHDLMQGAGRVRDAVTSGLENFDADTAKGMLTVARDSVVKFFWNRELTSEVREKEKVCHKLLKEKQPEREVKLLAFSEHCLDQHDKELAKSLEQPRKTRRSTAITSGVSAAATGVFAFLYPKTLFISGPLVSARLRTSILEIRNANFSIKAINSEREQVQNFRNTIQAAREIAKEDGKEQEFDLRLDRLTEANRQVAARNVNPNAPTTRLFEIDPAESPEDLYKLVTGDRVSMFLDENFSPKDATQGETVVTSITSDLADLEVSAAKPKSSRGVNDIRHDHLRQGLGLNTTPNGLTPSHQPQGTAKGMKERFNALDPQLEISEEEIENFVNGLTEADAADGHEASA
jgi:hypothetical protein